MRYLLVLLLSFNCLASELPKDITNDMLKVKAVELMREHLGNSYYTIDELLVKRASVEDKQIAVGINNIWGEGKKCFSYLIIADSEHCSNMKTCRLGSLIVDCSQLSTLLDELK